jgi:hypothetical protein
MKADEKIRAIQARVEKELENAPLSLERCLEKLSKAMADSGEEVPWGGEDPVVWACVTCLVFRHTVAAYHVRWQAQGRQIRDEHTQELRNLLKAFLEKVETMITGHLCPEPPDPEILQGIEDNTSFRLKFVASLQRGGDAPDKALKGRLRKARNLHPERFAGAPELRSAQALSESSRSEGRCDPLKEASELQLERVPQT